METKFGELIKKYRERMGLNRKQLAFRIEKPLRYIQSVEEGLEVFRFRDIDLLSDVLKLSLDERNELGNLAWEQGMMA